ncbi:MAG: hypothetical protein RL417_2424 [Pseudomonadota bacterium]
MAGSKKSPQHGSQPALDLGLGTIIAGERAVGGKIDEAPQNSPHPRNDKPPQLDTERRTEYSDLADRGNWRELLSLTESRTAGGGQGELEPRFWWVRASVALGSVPLSILAAPLETVSAEIVEARKRSASKVGEEVVEAAAVLLSEVSAKLLGQGDYATALNFAERAYRLLPASQENLVAMIARILELPEPSARRDPAGVRLRLRCQTLGEELGVPPRITPPKVSAATRPRAERASPHDRSAGRRDQPLSPKGGRAALPFGSFVVFLGMCLGGALVWRWTVTGSPGVSGETVISLIASEHRPVLAGPAIERTTSLSQLDAIFYDFDRGGGGRAALGRPSGVPPASSLRAGPKEVVNTQGPPEPKDVYQATQSPRDGAGGEDDVGSILFGSPKPRLPGARGGEPQPMGVERFNEQREYEVVASTKVLTRPSFTGSAVARLAAGDRVKAEGAVGDWLKIRSRNGQIGYILSQDVKPAAS